MEDASFKRMSAVSVASGVLVRGGAHVVVVLWAARERAPVAHTKHTSASIEARR